MIQLSDILTEETIFASIHAAEKEQVLKTLIQGLGLDVKQKEAVTKAIFEREAIISTGVGNEIGLPHCKLENIEKNYGAFAILAEPVVYESIDNLPVKFIFMLISPIDDTGQHLKLLSQISRTLLDGDFRKRVMDLKSKKAILNMFNEKKGGEAIG